MEIKTHLFISEILKNTISRRELAALDQTITNLNNKIRVHDWYKINWENLKNNKESWRRNEFVGVSDELVENPLRLSFVEALFSIYSLIWNRFFCLSFSWFLILKSIFVLIFDISWPLDQLGYCPITFCQIIGYPLFILTNFKLKLWFYAYFGVVRALGDVSPIYCIYTGTFQVNFIIPFVGDVTSVLTDFCMYWFSNGHIFFFTSNR